LKILNANQNVATDITVNMAEKIKTISPAIDGASSFSFLSSFQITELSFYEVKIKITGTKTRKVMWK